MCAAPVMASHMIISIGAETSGANLTSSAVENSAELHQTNQEFVMAQEFEVAFLDLQKDVANNEKLQEFVRSHYVNRLKTPELCAALQQRLNSTTNVIHDPLIVHNYFRDLSRLYREHSVMEETLKPMDESFGEQLRRIAVSKKVSAVFFTAAAAICAAAAAAAANANPKRVAAAACAAAASILFGAVGKWIHSLLKKRESAVRRHKEITELMIAGAKNGMKDLKIIQEVTEGLQFETESLSETVDFGKKVAAVYKSFEELKDKAEYYSCEMKRVKKLVIQTIIKQG